jgi:protein-(glutamine-N5) methyltransferase, release factor-specific
MTTKTELQSWIDQAIHALDRSETPYLEVQVITAFILGETREWVIAHPEYELNTSQLARLNAALARLQNQEPLAYITGQRAFYGMDFLVSPAVLIPRPETELLVEAAAAWLEANPHKRNAVDVGTGSGIIAISLADCFLDLNMIAIDISAEALDIAGKNIALHELTDRIQLMHNDLLTGLQGKFDLILANLPYIPSSTLAALEVGRYEPNLALDGGEDGLRLIRQLLRQSPDRLKPGGAIFLEIESTLGAQTQALAREFFPQAQVELHNDYADLPRLVTIQL